MNLDEFAARIRTSRAIVFFTGAGVSTESGVPDFRSPGGVWTKYQPVLFQDFLASESARVQHWQLKKATYELFKTVEPNLAHHAIREYEQRGQMLGLITQNIDGLHKIAGTSEEKLVELHGTDRLVTCLECDKPYEPAAIYENLPEPFTAPTCDDCGGFLKSANVSFGQSMPAAAMRQAQAWSERADVFIVLGSSLQVQPAASFPVIAKRAGALLAIINRDPTPLDEIADFVHHGAIGEFFRGLQARTSDG
ncbi:MAG TPA: Sir2 family NAD-dependent protein deacetylase [Candidatus Binatia bacterium]|nr:Sir2 family NAD-dependent protein deacetylase [Candidatus Binatia bacterium]